MDALYTTVCYPFSPSDFVNVPSNAYVPVNNVLLSPPYPLQLTYGEIFPTMTTRTYFINFIDNQPSGPPNVQNVQVTMNFTGTGMTYESSTIRTLPSLEVVVLPSLNNTTLTYNSSFDIQMTWHRNRTTDLNPNDFDEGDTYIITVNTSCPFNGTRVRLIRHVALILDTGNGIATDIILSDNNVINPCCQITCDKVRIPIIDIEGQTTFNGQYLSDMTFTIKDIYGYCAYDPILIKNKGQCKKIYSEQKDLKSTTFLLFNPPMQDVVKGKGKTLREKLLYYYNNHEALIGTSFNSFYNQMILYGMLKYILSKLLYGHFNIHYLCRHFNKQFFKDLNHSRFCGFIEFFNNPDNNIINYSRFFIKCC